MTTVIPKYLFLVLCFELVLIILMLYWDLGSHGQDKEMWRSANKVGNLKQWLKKSKTGLLVQLHYFFLNFPCIM